MEKISPKNPVVYERYKSSCAWSLIRFCDFGQGDSNNRKLISHGKGLNSQVLSGLDSRNRLDLLSNSNVKCQCIDGVVNNKSQMIDSAKADVMRMRKGEGEMATELQVNKKITNTEGQHTPSNNTQPVGRLPTNHKRKTSKTFQMHGCKDIATMGQRQPYNESSADRSSIKCTKAIPTEASGTKAHPRRDCDCRSVSHPKNNRVSEINLQVKMNEAAEAFVNQKFTKGKFLGKNKASHQSKHFLDALEILNSNKELFINLLQDPNSLLVKHIQDLRHSQGNKQEINCSFPEAKLSENCGTTVRSKEHVCNQVSCDRYPTKGSFDPQTSERIVVLKCGSIAMQNGAADTSDCSSPESLYRLRNEMQSAKPAYFSLGHMKRKLRHAIGFSRKEKKPSTSTDCTRHESPIDIEDSGDGGGGNCPETAQSNSLSKCNLGTGQMAKSLCVRKGAKMGKLKDSASGTKEPVAANGGSDLGNSTSSIVGYQDHGFNAAQMRFSSYSYYQMVNEKKQHQKEKKNGYLSPVRQIIEAPSLADYKRFTDQLQIFDRKPNDSGNHFPDIKRYKRFSSLSDPSSSRGSVYNSVKRGEISSLGVPLQSNESHNNGATQGSGPTYTYEDNELLECSKLDFPMESLTSPSSEDAYFSSPLSMKKLEESNGMKDKAEHASPVSVLDQFFVEDIPSPLSTISRSEPVVEPKQDYCEENSCTAPVTSPADLKINSSNTMNEHESLSQYVTAVLQASGTKWEELSMKCHSSDQLLEPSLIDEVELLPNLLTVDKKLLFDYINEVLLEVYQSHFSCCPRLSFLIPQIRPVQAGTNVVNEVMKCVDLDILFHRQFQTLEELVEKDLGKSRTTWMDIRIDTEVAVTELVESVLEELELEISIDLHT
ncbi:hypothetical protein KPL71_006425 [Citrus sinensis]|uniref:Uncharacterized protein n=1 Tax=Citrus sinensis TaxID=2711 RepID=A0ACB8LPZ2_CITSI|nr:hypothetical protein KPL71_006425 [Citrus sinensis]